MANSDTHIEEKYQPFSLSLPDAEKHFGIAVKTFRNWINSGKLARGRNGEYIKAGPKKILILTENFKEWLYREDEREWVSE